MTLTPDPMRILTSLLLAALFLTACADGTPEPETTVPATPEEILEGTDQLLGRWVITEQNGEAPENLFYVTFTETGEYLVQDQLGATQRATYSPTEDDAITVTDSTGTRHFTYSVQGPRLTLTEPESGSTTVMTRSENGL